MAELYTKHLEDKVARYERIMRSCAQCKPALEVQESDHETLPSRLSPSSQLRRPPDAEVAPIALTLSSSRHTVALQPLPPPATRPSKKPSQPLQEKTTSRTSQKSTPVNRSHTVSNPSGQVVAVPSPVTKPPSTNSSKQPIVIPSLSKTPSRQSISTIQRRSSRPSFLVPSESSERSQSTDKSVGLDSQVQYEPKPAKLRDKLGRPPIDTGKQPPWIIASDIMLGEVPLGWKWREELSKINKSILAAVDRGHTLLPENSARTASAMENSEHLVQLVRGFAHRHSEGRVFFQQFLLVCLCKVLSSHDVPEEQILRTMQICVTDTKKQNIGKYLKGVTWVNKLMDQLFFTEWAYRAVDLIIIWNRPIATYGKLAVAPDARLYVTTHLTRQEYFDELHEIPDRIQDTIPWIVQKELGDEISYEKVCKALGYSEEYSLRTKHLHSSELSLSNLDAEDSNDVGSSSTPRSFHTSRQTASRASSLQQSGPTDTRSSNDLTGASRTRESPTLRNQLYEEGSADDSGASTSELVTSQRTKRVIPDRSTKPFGLSDIVGRRKQPHAHPTPAELPSTSLGERAPESQGAKRPLPESPTSAFQPINPTRRRQHPIERSSREEMGLPSQSRKKGSKK